MSMLSIMESTPDHRQDLAAAERAAAAPYVDYPPTPAWYPAAVGAWAAALVGALTLLDRHPVLRGVVLVSLVAVEGGFFAWYRSYRGTMPSLRHAPTEISREFRWYSLGLVVVVALVAGTALLVSQVAAVVLTFLLVTAGAASYERRYARAAEATRARLS
jgi:hypothetical protein